MKPAELLTVALTIPLVTGALIASDQAHPVHRRHQAGFAQAQQTQPVPLEEIVVTAKRLGHAN